ncbi:MazG-like family protein [Thalassolituus sp. UBA3500]|uniref:MazG-like family protein n=1 Tax=Thalassolituus sp. UBA3500 TaxID=1947664 RepID=UPI000C0ECE92|nr:MazG-like family protein [Thalassolituus sp. UBA3500]MBN57821.1 hypothetical protein [Oceanospirillaceae bacterium]|tara:strand:+ start:5408 stop:5701 length:294 start_codon:yes stop_codon:yes gene_type:complete
MTEPKIPHLASAALQSVMQEMKAQDLKWGADRDQDLADWLLILTEEAGELAEAVLHIKFGGEKKYGLRTEAVQVAAVALQIIEYIDRNDIMESINEY